MISLIPLRRYSAQFENLEFVESQMKTQYGVRSEEFRSTMKGIEAVADTYGDGTRKNGEPAFNHEMRSIGNAWFLGRRDVVTTQTILFHDMPEDKRPAWSFARIKREYWPGVDVRVKPLTNPNQGEMSDHEFNLLLARRWRKAGRDTVQDKADESLDGLLNPWPGGREKMLKKRDETLRYKIPLMIEFGLDPYPLYTACGMLTRRYRLHPTEN